MVYRWTSGCQTLCRTVLRRVACGVVANPLASGTEAVYFLSGANELLSRVKPSARIAAVL